jgi:hypothetical protein
VDGEVPFTPSHRDSLRNGPTCEGAVAFEPKVVVEPPRGMPLDDEAQAGISTVTSLERLGRRTAPPLLPILVEAHLWIVA